MNIECKAGFSDTQSVPFLEVEEFHDRYQPLVSTERGVRWVYALVPGHKIW